MKILVLSGFGLFMTASMNETEPTVGGIDLEASKIEWVGKKVTGKHNGTIDLKSGKLMMNDKGEITGGMFEIDMSTITVLDLSGNMKSKLEGHLNSDDFFSTDTYPVATVELTNAEKTGDNTYNISSNVTIKGITNPVEFKATVKDGKAMADITVDRTKYDVKYGSGSFFDGLGDKMIYDDFELSVTLVME